MSEDPIRKLDATIADACAPLKVLSRLSWPSDVMTSFLSNWRRGRPTLPQVAYADNADLEDTLAILGTADKSLARIGGPLADYLGRTARSYMTLCQLLAAAGTPAMLAHSRSLYGSPGDALSEGQVNNLDAARFFLQSSHQYECANRLDEAQYCLSAQVMKAELEARLTEVFPADVVRVVIDPKLASKAAAGATRIRLRGKTSFSEYDLEQLLQHEAFVHSLTALNGRAQPGLRCMALGAPRTTRAQEGLATFSEIVTGAIDIDRMERIALRVVAIDMALAGADFIEVFRFFIDAGQPDSESFNSAMRVFRGAPLTGGAAFTKDVVYLHGLMEVHTFFRWAMHNQRMELCRYFFAGRMTIGDAIRLRPLFEDGTLHGPKYLPVWMTKANGLAGYLAFSIFANRISIEALDEHHRFDHVEELST